MARTQNQKKKLLLLLELFHRQSDENHPLSIQDIIDALAAEDITAERKSLYSDIEELRNFGYDIVGIKGKGYYLGQREFQLPELRLLVDAVQSSKFITPRKSNELIAKIEQLTSVYQARDLQRQVALVSRSKMVNETIYYNIDSIHEGISNGRQITFHYFRYNVDKEQVLRRNGALYRVSPFAMVWEHENYYMVGFDSDSRSIRHYRVDKMKDITVTRRIREGEKEYRVFELGSYTQRHFGMFHGKEETVTLRCSNELVGVILERFGFDSILVPDGPEHFTVAAPVVVSAQFTGWLFGLGDQIQVKAPAWVRDQMKGELRKALELYERGE